MIDLSQYSSVLVLAALVGAILQFAVKPVIPDKRLIPIAAMVVGVALALVVGIAEAKVVDPPTVASYALAGLLAGLTSVGGYEAAINQRLKAPPIK